jgi:hypothetical protein
MTTLSKRLGKCGDLLRRKSVAIPVLMIREPSIQTLTYRNRRLKRTSDL